jgi:hypothetical protein
MTPEIPINELAQAEKMAALDAFYNAAVRLDREWTREGYAEFLDAGYPKCLPSFDEFVEAVADWTDEARTALFRSQSRRVTLDLTPVELQHLVECVFISADASAGDDTHATADGKDTVEGLTERVYGKVLLASRAAGYEPTGFNGPLPEPHELEVKTLPPVGARVRLKFDVERFPHFIAKAGSTGRVVGHESDGLYRVRLDVTLPGAEEWDNEVQWTADDNPMDDVEAVR